MNRSEATRILAVLRTVYSQQDADPDLDMVWAMVLDDVPYEAAMAAVTLYLKSDKPFFPKPGEIRSLLIEQLMHLPSPEEAWAEVMRAIREHGSYRAPAFSCHAIHEAVSSIGWREICMSEKIEIERAHFYRTYQAYRDRAVKHVDMAALMAGEDRRLDWSNPVNRVPMPITAKDGVPF